MIAPEISPAASGRWLWEGLSDYQICCDSSQPTTLVQRRHNNSNSPPWGRIPQIRTGRPKSPARRAPALHNDSFGLNCSQLFSLCLFLRAYSLAALFSLIPFWTCKILAALCGWFCLAVIIHAGRRLESLTLRHTQAFQELDIIFRSLQKTYEFTPPRVLPLLSLLWVSAGLGIDAFQMRMIADMGLINSFDPLDDLIHELAAPRRQSDLNGIIGSLATILGFLEGFY